MTESILKWAGGKHQILDKITLLFPRKYKKYHEPMVGGGAVYFSIKPKSGTINDLNESLMHFYEIVKENPNELIQENKKHKYTKEYYYKAREEFNKIKGKEIELVKEASLFLFLNRTCYNGLYRVNSKSEFNVPFGRYSNPDFVREKQIRECSKILQNFNLLNDDFSYIVGEAKKNDLVYLDPPYEPVSKTANFVAYIKEGFDFKEQKRLKNVCMELDELGVFFILSNSWVKPIREMYRGIKNFDIIKIQAVRNISSNPQTRKGIYEILVTNIPFRLRRQNSGKMLDKNERIQIGS